MRIFRQLMILSVSPWVLALTISACATSKGSHGSPQRASAPVSMPVLVEQTQSDVTASQAVVPANGLLASNFPLLQAVPQYQPGTWQADVQRTVDSIVSYSPMLATSQLGLLVYDLDADRPLSAINAAQRLRPASCQKVITAVAALQYLGAQHPFTTELRTTGVIQGSTLVGDVYVVGGMDPLLSRGEIFSMAHALRQKGITAINGRLYADLSMKDDNSYGWGWCWDDDYGPLTPLMADGKPLFMEAWRAALREAQISLSSPSLLTETCPAKGSTLITSISHSLAQVLDPMLKKSDNIFAESVFYQLAASLKPRGASRAQAVSLINDLIAEQGLDPSDYQMADGSGLSLYNYASPQLLVSLLRLAHRSPDIRDIFETCLPIAGVDGTLQRRMKGTLCEGNVRAKTGSVDGVCTLSGYLTTRSGHRLAFSIMNQGMPRNSTARDFQDALLERLAAL